MNILKSKSLTKELNDFEIETGCHSTSFLSFERAITESLELNRINKKPIGYKVLDQGIEIVWD